jgi:dihydroorotate dehydrogenase (NAD+) catalytic subunit
VVAIARAVVGAGADALTIANTYPAMSLDVTTGRSRIGSPTGGLSGPAIKPITLRLVHEVAKALKTPILGLGGIESADDILEYLLAGAAATQVGTASFVDPRATVRLVNALEQRCAELSVCKINEIQTMLRK